MFFRLVQSENDCQPIDVTESGIVILIKSSLSSNAASLNGFNLPGTTSGIGSINQGNSSSLSGHELKQILVDVFDGASWSLQKSKDSGQTETLSGYIDILAGPNYAYNSDVTNRQHN